MDANGTVTATVKDNAGNTSSTTIEVKNIDKTAPTLELTLSTTDWIEEGLTVSATATDGESGLPVKCFSVNGGDYSFSNSVFLTENGPVTFSVVDNAGNVTTKTVVVQNIGRDPAVVAREKLEKEKAEKERIAAEKAAAEKAEKERIAAEKAAAEKAEKERIAAEKAEKERIAAEKAAAEKAEKERKAAEKAAAEKAEKERIAAEKAAAEKAASEKAIAEAARKLAEQQTQAEKEAAERVAREQASREQAIKEAQQRAAEAAARAEAERLAAEKAAREESERIAAENAARAEAERIAAENAARAEADRIKAEEAVKAAAEKATAEAAKKTKTDEVSALTEENAEGAEENEAEDDDESLLPLDTDADGGGSDGGNGGNMIKFTDTTATESPVDYFSMSELEANAAESTESEIGAESGLLNWLKTNSGTLFAGTVILLAGMFLLSLFSYVYVSSDGKTKIVALAKVKVKSDRVIVEVQESKLQPNGRYLVFLSVWARIASKNRPVYIKAGSAGNVACAGDSLCFTC